MLKAALPAQGLEMCVIHRASGLGSLGRERYTAIAEWCGGGVAREVKRLLPSACFWQDRDGAEHSEAAPIEYQAVLDHAVRAPDPFAHQEGEWIIRRLAPDCSRISLSDLPKERDEARLLGAMGWEVGNIHLASDDFLPTRATGRVLDDLKKRPADWLLKASQAMANATVRDWEDYKNDKTT